MKIHDDDSQLYFCIGFLSQGLRIWLLIPTNNCLFFFLNCDFVVGFGVFFFGLNYTLPNTDREHTEASDNLAGIYGHSLLYRLDIDIGGQMTPDGGKEPRLRLLQLGGNVLALCMI